MKDFHFKSIFFILTQIFIISLLLGCTTIKGRVDKARSNKSSRIEVTKGLDKQETNIIKTYNTKFDNIAKLLAGMDLPKNSRLYKRTKSRQYINYKAQINSLWNRFQAPNLYKITKWRNKNLPIVYSENILYPFSGPDIINALAFYPKGKNYIMFGLEEPGQLPNPDNLTDTRLMSELYRVKRAMSNILGVNFFMTRKMQRFLTKTSFSGVTGVLMFFLTRGNYEILEVKKIFLDIDGNLVYKKPVTKRIVNTYPYYLSANTKHNKKSVTIKVAESKKRYKKLSKTNIIKGIEIVFREYKNAPIKKVRYFAINVIDKHIKEFYSNFITYLSNINSSATLIKSASYLLHYETFSIIRSLIMSKSNIILQDDSGIALNFYNPNKWTLKYFGYYKRPIKLFKARYQNSLYNKIKKHSKGVLPFSYGYRYKKGRSNLILATKRINKF